MPAATAAAPPPEEPPGVFAGFQGLRVMPVSGLSVTPFQPNSGVVVLPSSTAPCSRSRATAGASSFHGPFGIDRLRAAQRRPAPGEEQVLDRHRHAVERPIRLALHPARFGLGGLRRSAVGRDEAERIQHRVERLDPLQHRARRLHGRDALCCDTGAAGPPPNTSTDLKESGRPWERGVLLLKMRLGTWGLGDRD